MIVRPSSNHAQRMRRPLVAHDTSNFIDLQTVSNTYTLGHLPMPDEDHPIEGFLRTPVAWDTASRCGHRGSLCDERCQQHDDQSRHCCSAHVTRPSRLLARARRTSGSGGWLRFHGSRPSSRRWCRRSDHLLQQFGSAPKIRWRRRTRAEGTQTRIGLASGQSHRQAANPTAAMASVRPCRFHRTV